MGKTERATLEAQDWGNETFASLRQARLSRILIIEDNEHYARAVRTRLETDYEVLVCRDGLTGIRLIEEEQPDLVILDIGLPGMSGFKLLHELHVSSRVVAPPIIVLTGSSDETTAPRAHAWGVRTVLRKPVPLKRVVDAVEDALEYEA